MITTSAQTLQTDRIDQAPNSVPSKNYSGVEPPASRVAPEQALRLNEYISASYAAHLERIETPTNSRHIRSGLAENLHRLGLLLFPVAETTAGILKMYSGTAYGLGLATKDAALHYMAPIEVEVEGEVDVKTTLGDEVCSTHIKDSYHLPDNPGIDLADLNLSFSIMGFLLGEAGEVIFGKLEHRSQAFLASKSVAHGIHQGVLKFLESQVSYNPGSIEANQTEEAQTEDGAAPSYLASITPLPTTFRKSSALIKAVGLFGIMAYIHTSALRSGMPLTTYKGLDNMQVLAPQNSTISGTYSDVCDIKNAPSAFDPIITAKLDGVLEVPESYTRGLNAESLMQLIVIAGLGSYLIGSMAMRKFNHQAISHCAKETTFNYLQSHSNDTTRDLSGLKTALEKQLILSRCIPAKVYQTAKATVERRVDQLTNASATQPQPTAVTDHKPLLSCLHALLKMVQTGGSETLSFKSIGRTLDNVSDTLLVVGFVMQTATEGIEYISTGFNGILTSSETRLKFGDQVHEPGEFRNESGTVDAYYEADVTFPKTRTKGIVSDATVQVIVLALGLKVIAKLIRSHAKRSELRCAIQNIIEQYSSQSASLPHTQERPTPSEIEAGRAETVTDRSHPVDPSIDLSIAPPSEIRAINRADLVKHIVEQLHLQGHTPDIEHHGFKLGCLVAVPALKNYAPAWAEENHTPCLPEQCCPIPRPISTLSDTIQKSAYDLANKLGSLGLFLGVGAQLTEEIIKDSAILFNDNATIHLGVDTALTIGNITVNRPFNATYETALDNLEVPNPSKVTLYVALVGLGTGAVLLPLSALFDIIHSESVVQSEIRRAVARLPNPPSNGRPAANS